MSGKQIPINMKFAEERHPNIGKYESIGIRIGRLVDEKNRVYGESFKKSADFLKLLYPNGIKPEQYGDLLGLIRIFDKQMRIATAKEALGENPWEDISGYGFLNCED